MYRASVETMASTCGAVILAGDPSRQVSGFVVDSRLVTPGSVFVCFLGETQDGNDYALPAMDSGAACVVMTREPSEAERAKAAEKDCCLIRAANDDAGAFLLDLAEHYRLQQDWAVLGVTGSVGKTTTKDLLAQALATTYRVHKNVGNFNSVIGVPLTILSAPDDTQVFVCEMGMNHPGEIDAIARCARPQMACITNIGTSHIGILGSRENIALAKSEVIPWLAADASLSCCVDLEPVLALASGDDFTCSIGEAAKGAGVLVDRVGFHPDDRICASQVSLSPEGCPAFDVTFCGDRVHQELKLTGRQCVIDDLLALDLAQRAGLTLTQAASGLDSLEPQAMRAHIIRAARGFRIIDDTYNASPSSLAVAADLLCELPCEGRRIAVIGEVGELGDEAPRLHGLMGAYLAAKPLDMLVLVGDKDADAMAEAASTMGFSEDKLVRVPTAAAAASIVGPVLEAGDLVLAKGSRFVGLDAFVEEVRS